MRTLRGDKAKRGSRGSSEKSRRQCLGHPDRRTVYGDCPGKLPLEHHASGELFVMLDEMNPCLRRLLLAKKIADGERFADAGAPLCTRA